MVEFHEQQVSIFIGQDAEGEWFAKTRNCPACGKMVVHLVSGHATYNQPVGGRVVAAWQTVIRETMVRPKGSGRPPCPPEVPTSLSGDYVEACTVLPDSPKAAAALGRRCLQNLLRDTVKVKSGDLSDEIQQVLDSGKLPSGLHNSIDAVRNVGNFAAHPMKSKQTGLILDVEPGEAEWTLDVLEELFDFCFVLPATIQKKKDAFNRKLQEAASLQ